MRVKTLHVTMSQDEFKELKAKKEELRMTWKEFLSHVSEEI